MKKSYYCLFILISLSQIIYSQSSLYIPLDIKKAYDKGTRTYKGMAGPNYWQNHSNYKISASIDPQTRLLKGEEEIVYHNESPDTLKKIIIRLYQDINRAGNARDWDLTKEGLTDGLILEKLTIGASQVNLTNEDSASRSVTNLTITLKEPVMPHSATNITSEWHFTIPRVSNIRMGTYDSTTFYIAYWYPQIAVYDDIHGWDKIEYKGILEFYNDFSNFDVEITVPNTFCTWATGVLQNSEDIMTADMYSRYKYALSSDSVVKIISKEDLIRNNLFAKTSPSLTWHYKAENVTDFAFGTSDHYLWDGVSLEVEPGRNVFISSAYNPASNDFYEVDYLAKEIIESYLKDFPAVPFPYPKMTIFNGDGGMEYPMMVNEGSSDERDGTVYVTAHEIAHTYFPFYMGTNERRWAFMDEGWAQALSFDIQVNLAPDWDTRSNNVKRYLGCAGMEEDIPMMVPSYNLSRFRSYRSASYLRPGEAYDILRSTLGEEMFLKALHEYMNSWNGKHPIPYDFFFTFNNVTGEDLSWYWNPWFFEFGYPDLAIKNVIYENGVTKISIEKIGNIPIPINLEITYADSSLNYIFKPADCWKDGNKLFIIEDNSGKNIVSIKLGNDHIPDVDSTNNHWERKSINN
jgi:hypothetical protein